MPTPNEAPQLVNGAEILKAGERNEDLHQQLELLSYEGIGKPVRWAQNKHTQAIQMSGGGDSTISITDQQEKENKFIGLILPVNTERTKFIILFSGGNFGRAYMFEPRDTNRDTLQSFQDNLSPNQTSLDLNGADILEAEDWIVRFGQVYGLKVSLNSQRLQDIPQIQADFDAAWTLVEKQRAELVPMQAALTGHILSQMRGVPSSAAPVS